jgi:hypothetical protein
MGSKTWVWEESFHESYTKEFIEYEILVKEEESKNYSYRTKGYLVNEK